MGSFLRTDCVCKVRGGHFHVGYVGSFCWVTVLLLFKVKVMNLHILSCWINEFCKVKVHLHRVCCMS